MGRGLICCDSVLEKAREQLGVLAALRTATETYSEQKRKRKDAPTDAQPTKTKKARTYLFPHSRFAQHASICSLLPHLTFVGKG
jgi:hypothetical protein